MSIRIGRLAGSQLSEVTGFVGNRGPVPRLAVLRRVFGGAADDGAHPEPSAVGTRRLRNMQYRWLKAFALVVTGRIWASWYVCRFHGVCGVGSPAGPLAPVRWIRASTLATCAHSLQPGVNARIRP